jgi:Ankyrin repeats (3 copies)
MGVGCWKSERRIDVDLREAAYFGNVAEIKRLVSLGANVNARSETGFKDTPLTWALSNSQTDAAILLIDLGADPNATNGSGETPLSTAVVNRSEAAAFVRYALAHGAIPRAEKMLVLNGKQGEELQRIYTEYFATQSKTKNY